MNAQNAEKPLASFMKEIGYYQIQVSEYPLPNGKKPVCMDFEK